MIQYSGMSDRLLIDLEQRPVARDLLARSRVEAFAMRDKE
jgi:hypothetical protein